MNDVWTIPFPGPTFNLNINWVHPEIGNFVRGQGARRRKSAVYWAYMSIFRRRATQSSGKRAIYGCTRSKSGICSLNLIQHYELMVLERDQQFLSRFHQGEARVSRTQVCKIVQVCIQKAWVARTAAVGESWKKLLVPRQLEQTE